MLQMIDTLEQKDHAYAASNGDVYYAVETFEGYVKLSKRKLEDYKQDHVSMSIPIKRTHLTLYYGKLLSQVSHSGILIGVVGVRAGILNVLPCRPNA